jgi:Ca2+/H+ antiporter, TMEM165/GDT1 family
VNFAVVATVFVVVFPAELPDKTALASLVLGARYRSTYVFAGAAAAFVLHVILAVAAGSLVALLPHRLLEAVVAAVFLIGAVLLLRGRPEEVDEKLEVKGDPSFLRVAGTSFLVVIVAEFGDLTQIVTANLAAKYHNPIEVGLGAVLGLWAVAALAIVGGRNLLKFVSLIWVTRIAAVIMLVMAVVSLISAIRG